MTKQTGFGLVEEPEDASDEKRSYRLHPSEWLLLFCVICAVAGQKAATSVYTSRDGNAIALSIKAGKDRKAYWIGPDDSAHDVLHGAIRQWGIDLGTREFSEFLDWLASKEGQKVISDG